MRILDLGCGNNKYPNSIGLDIMIESKADILCNLNSYPLPFKDNTFDEIISKQVLEHLNDLEALMKELHRISKHNTRINIFVPHFSCFYSYADPSHKRTFSFFSFDKLSQKLDFLIIEKEITFHKAIRRYMLDNLFNRFPLAYERFWAFILPAEHLRFEFKVIKNC